MKIVAYRRNNEKAKITNEDEYILVDIQEAAGGFVGTVRAEYENKLQDIIEKCTNPNVFKSEQAKEIIRYVKEKYNDDLEFLWKKFDDNIIKNLFQNVLMLKE